MIYLHEGEFLLKETYGSSGREITYVKPDEQNKIVIIDKNKVSDILTWLKKIFLPQGYPDSVSKDYIQYQVWDTAQAFCSTITGTLATQEVLRGVGVGDTTATPLSATITWVFKDGCGHVGRILFAWTHGTYLDAYSKRWRLYADTLNDAAMCMEIALPLFRNHTTLVLCITTMMKAVVGVAGGATRAALTQHHAVRGNMADVSAKDSAQETAVNLVASLVALCILSVLGNSLLIFAIMVVAHIVCNYFAVRAICLRTLNEPRFLQVIDTYLRHEIIPTPCEINRTEPILFYHLGQNLMDLKVCGFKVKMGYSMKKLVAENPAYSKWKTFKDLYGDLNYALYADLERRRMYMFLVENATTDDILCAYFHAVILSIIVCSINFYPLAIYNKTSAMRPFPQVCHILQTVEWTRDVIQDDYLPDDLSPDESIAMHTLGGRFKYNPSEALLKYVASIVDKEWIRVRRGLMTTGWDMQKHLLIMEEWRIASPAAVPKHISFTQNFDDVTAAYKEKTSITINPFSEILEDIDTINLRSRKDVCDHSTSASESDLMRCVTREHTIEPDDNTSYSKMKMKDV